MELKAAGLDSLTGGGAEIFRKEVRSTIAKGKESAEEYLDVHRTWHRLGGRSTCTMLYGHVESLADRVDHLRQLRALQDETHGFTGFVPLAYQPENNDIPVEKPPTGFDSLRTIAVSRIYLDNFDHITAYWVGLGLKLAQVALSYGADDLHGTIIEEHIFHMAGATSPQLQTEADMLKAIREAGRTPIQRNTFYEPIKVLAESAIRPRRRKIPRTRKCWKIIWQRRDGALSLCGHSLTTMPRQRIILGQSSKTLSTPTGLYHGSCGIDSTLSGLISLRFVYRRRPTLRVDAGLND